VLTPVLIVHDRMAEPSILVDDMELSVADGVLPDLETDLDG
jgi:hypothetical protein